MRCINVLYIDYTYLRWEPETTYSEVSISNYLDNIRVISKNKYKGVCIPKGKSNSIKSLFNIYCKTVNFMVEQIYFSENRSFYPIRDSLGIGI